MTVVDISKQKGSPMFEHIDDPELRERVLAAQRYLAGKYTELGTWKKVAAFIRGASESAIVAFNNGSYNANPSKLVASIERARTQEEERAATVFMPQFVDTSMARRIRRVVRQTRARGGLAICAGQSGIGKTTAFREMLASSEPIVYLRCNPMFGSRVWPVLRHLGGTLGSEISNSASPVAVYEQLRKQLQSKRITLVLDEAQFLSRQALDTLRTLSEDSETPIVFAGNDQLHEFGFLAGSNPAAFVQFTSRCGVVEFLQRSEITKGDVALIATQKLDDEVFDETRDALLQEARSEGGFRRLHSILQRAHEKARGGHASAEQVFAAIADMRKRGVL